MTKRLGPLCAPDVLGGVIGVTGYQEGMRLNKERVLQSLRFFEDNIRDFPLPRIRSALESVLMHAEALDPAGGRERWIAFFVSVEALLDTVEDEGRGHRAVEAWRCGERLAEVESALEYFARENQDERWRSFGDLVFSMIPAQKAVNDLVTYLPLPSSAPRVTSAAVHELLEKADEVFSADELVQQCGVVWRVRRGVEMRLRQLWPGCTDEQRDDGDAVASYAAQWDTLLPGARAKIRGADCRKAATDAAKLARSMGVSEAADFAEDIDRMLLYAVANLMPPVSRATDLSGCEAVAHFLNCQISQWYFEPFRRSLHPMTIIKGVIATRRPLYYERAFAHGLTQYLILQRFLEPSSPQYLQMLDPVATHCALLLACSSLGTECKPGLKHPRGWIEYLERLLTLHETGAPADVLAMVRSSLLGAIGTSRQ